MPKMLKFTFLVIVLGLVLTGAIGSIILKQPFLMAPIRSNSMYPLIERGDIVFIYPVHERNDISKGDIVVFRPEGGSLAEFGWVIHRVVGGSVEKGFITRGDANDYTDQRDGAASVEKKSIVAKAFIVGGNPLKIPLLGYPSLWFGDFHNSPYVLPACLGLLALLLILTELREKGTNRHSRVTPAYVIYPAAGFIVCILLCAVQIAASSFFTLEYEVSSSGRGVIMGSSVGVIQKGDVITRDISEVGGTGIIPMAAAVVSDDRQFSFNKKILLTNPEKGETISVTINAKHPGEYKSKIIVGLFLPLLPPVFIHSMACFNYWMALVGVSLIPSLPFMLWPVVDSCLRRAAGRAFRRRINRVKYKLLP